MTVHPRAGTPARPEDLVDLDELFTAYPRRPDPSVAEQRVAFGTSGHRGSALALGFNDDHVAAISQAICEYRAAAGTRGPLFLGRDTHALSEPAWSTALEVFAANDVTVLIDSRGRYTPTPAVSHAILRTNRHTTAATARADGVVVTPSHNPPEDGGLKYNPPHGGPADTDATSWIATRANELLAGGCKDVRRTPVERALASDHVRRYDFLRHYVDDLGAVLDLAAIRDTGVRVGADPLGGAAVDYWGEIARCWKLELTVLNPEVDPRFAFMTLDWDGRIRMDCSSPYAMVALVSRKADFQLACGNDPDADRHGIVTPDGGLMNPNHFLAVAIEHLYTHRPGWPAGAAVGKTAVSSSTIDRVAAGLGRRLVEVPVGFKWFVPGLLGADPAVTRIGFGGEESAGASFLRADGTVWTTDKDGVVMALLAAEITAITGTSPSQRYRELTEKYGDPSYARTDVATSAEAKARLGKLDADDVAAKELAGEPITAKLTSAPGNGAPLGGLKVVTDSGWFAARPSGTEDVYKIYAESFAGAVHLARIQDEARELVDRVVDGC